MLEKFWCRTRIGIPEFLSTSLLRRETNTSYTRSYARARRCSREENQSTMEENASLGEPLTPKILDHNSATTTKNPKGINV